jgi:hypothetical protein
MYLGLQVQDWFMVQSPMYPRVQMYGHELKFFFYSRLRVKGLSVPRVGATGAGMYEYRLPELHVQELHVPHATGALLPVPMAA